MKIIVELPHDDYTSGGVRRMLKLVLELPTYDRTSGGITESLKMSRKTKPLMFVRFQRLMNSYPLIENTWTVGLPDNTFPACDVCITYSDNPYMNKLIALPQVKKVLIYMLSYGMSIDVERRNVKNEKVTVMCSTRKIENAIRAEGVKVHRIGFALDMEDMINEGLPRKEYLAVMYNPMVSKQYNEAVKMADYLFKEGIIDGVLSFGTSREYARYKHPKGLVQFFPDADRTTIKDIFNKCKCYLMPSVSEGLNLSPIESTLCGCPAVICDGAIGEIYFDRKNCQIAKSSDKTEMMNQVWDIIVNFEIYSSEYENYMRELVAKYTWDKVITRLNKLL
jgi:glycosyltransferase involved in cell wall biosynthesis